MLVKAKYLDRVRVWVHQDRLSEFLKITRECLSDVGHNTVSYFQAVDVRMILLNSNKAVVDCGGWQGKNTENEEQYLKAGPII